MSVDDHAIDPSLTRETGQKIGQYRLDLKTGAWWWSSETYRVHGFEPGDVVPTTELVLAHKHPDDREHVRAVLDHAEATGEPFSSVHRIMDAHGVERYVVLVGQGRRDRESGEVVELLGYFVDITTTVAGRAQERARRDITAAAEGRGPIEQAKGIIALAYRVTPDAAFASLRRSSSLANVKVRDIAESVVAVAQDLPAGADPRPALDRVLAGVQAA